MTLTGIGGIEHWKNDEWRIDKTHYISNKDISNKI